MPTKFRAGTAFEYERALSDYPASSWSLALHLAGPGPKTIAATEEGDTFVITVGKTESEGLTPGVYRWTEFATETADPENVREVATGTVIVLLNLATATGTVGQSFAEKMLAAIEDVLAGRATADTADAYTIDNISISRVPQEVLLRERRRLKSEVALARRPGRFGSKIRMNFGAGA